MLIYRYLTQHSNMPNIIILANENGRFRHTTRTPKLKKHTLFLIYKQVKTILGTGSVHIYLGAEFV
jgi:hypothetical protein